MLESGGEARDYGDFISGVKATNESVFSKMTDLGAGSFSVPRKLVVALGAAAWLSERAESTSLRRRDVILPLSRRPPC